MKISEIAETLRQSFEALWANKLRSLLAMLGVVIGIFVVILMGWLLWGLDRALEETFNLIGVDMLYIDKWEWAGGKNWRQMEYRKPITLLQAEQFCERIKSAELAIPIARKWIANIEYNGQTMDGVGVQGTKTEFSKTSGGTIIEGRFFNQTEDMTAANVAVLGYSVYTTFFPNGDGIGKFIEINGRKFYIAGVVKKQSTVLIDFLDKQVYIPLTSFIGIYGQTNRSFSIAVKAGNKNQLDEVRAESEGIMRTVRNIQPGKPDDFSINETKAFESSVATLRLYVWGIGIGMTVLSFIVGIIGIMNIMFVSVVERTREIGIRKAIGAKRMSIWSQFIVESATLCLFGAFIAFIVCYIVIVILTIIISKLVPSLSFLQPIIPLDLLLIASLVSIVVGVLAGFIPALRASRLDPVDALRYE